MVVALHRIKDGTQYGGKNEISGITLETANYYYDDSDGNYGSADVLPMG